ncbi:non-canonical purine NTP pyrophosphatase [Helicobacter sp. MIT 14-3879]|uniref:non-canonical purine NTP pyrophosphatase n=1 Tax=Helicobacter sp. MIT 14-3879 TaxID=2040649 RepID=UPI0015F16616|nr:non-canonical purine NTP pyrophosphatase [Helicobacter sp. MIT 14-3879]
MNIILFSNNKHKASEIGQIFSNYKIELYTQYLPPFDVDESGETFRQNAFLKLAALKNMIENNKQTKQSNILNNSILMAEDSGICVEELDNKPGIHSARFANINSKNANDKENIKFLIKELNDRGFKNSNAYFISCVACYTKGRYLHTYGFLNGVVIDKEYGNNGFGYDPIFIPNGFECTLACLDNNTKNKISHRFKALDLMKILLQ